MVPPISDNDKRPMLIIDGLNVFIRHFMVNESMNSHSEPVGGVVGFLKSIDLLVERFAPSGVIVVWESGGASPRRKALFPGYKANRAKIKEFQRAKKGFSTMKDVLRTDTDTKIKQLSVLYNLLKTTPVCQIFIKDTECDDIIGYLSKYKFRNRANKIIVSSDKDFYQLLEDKNLKIYDPARKITIDSQYIVNKFGISPNNFCLARTMQGDPSDNLEGVTGIGFKTLTSRFKGFENGNVDLTIEDVLSQSKGLLAEKKTAKLKAPKEILECEDLIRRNWKLMYLNSSNLSASQIQKVEGAVDMHEPNMDQLGLIKEISKAGINISFDFNRFSTNARRYLIFS